MKTMHPMQSQSMFRSNRSNAPRSPGSKMVSILGLFLGPILGLFWGLLLAPSMARAQNPPPPAGVVQPGSVAATIPEAAPPGVQPAPTKSAEVVLDTDREIDLSQIVTSAAKGVTTVQEAPAIITIITAEEIRQRGFREIGQVLATIPGWIDTKGEGNQVTLPMVRGAVQAVLYLRDGVSMFDPAFNLASTNRSVPLENIKRIEVVTGPGGVLWGANSYLGIVNVITKDAEDVNGLEMNVGYGDGKGNAQDFRAWAIFGRSFFKNRLKVFLHASYENYLGEQFSGRQYFVGSPTPQPLGPSLLGLGTVSSDIARSWLLTLDGKVSAGPFSLYWNVPFGEMNYASTFGPPILTKDLDPKTGMPCRGCDRSTWNIFERYAILEYRDRFVGQKLGLDAKAYYINFDRTFAVRIFPTSVALDGGLTLNYVNANIQRYGGTVDLDFSGPWSWNRLLAGAELFHESASGDGPNGSISSVFLQPAAANLPLVCPVDSQGKATEGCRTPFLFGGAERTVAGLFIADQVRPFSKLTLDGGVRYQQGFGNLFYAGQILGSAAAVWQFLPDVHLKLNWSQGFRPPVFNNTNGNGGSVQFGGNANLGVEHSESYSAEVNARLLRNVKKVRELQLRLDYAYTLLDNIIVVRSGKYQNAGRRAINSVEFLGKLYLQGDHYLTLAYTFQQIASTDNGEFRSVPRHYFQLGAVFNIIRNLLDLNGNLTVYGGADDPNRYPSGTATIPSTTAGGAPMSAVAARISDFTYDRLPPIAVLQVGARVKLWKDHVILSGQFYNVLNQSWYQPDVFFDQAPIIEMRPNPAPAWSFFSSVTYRPF